MLACLFLRQRLGQLGLGSNTPLAENDIDLPASTCKVLRSQKYTTMPGLLVFNQYLNSINLSKKNVTKNETNLKYTYISMCIDTELGKRTDSL